MNRALRFRRHVSLRPVVEGDEDQHFMCVGALEIGGRCPSDEPDPKSENRTVISDTHFNGNGLPLKTRKKQERNTEVRGELPTNSGEEAFLKRAVKENVHP